ncbi:MAG: LD-carboxypeptidase [Desulforegulaceae bacterium]|nr:LD-carboxypeptidase [Desulforegulaceae bacterium]
MELKNLFPALEKGDKIGIASISGRVEKGKILEGAKFIENFGYFPVFAENIFDSYRYLSGSDESRINGFLNLLGQKDIKGIIFARGGFGCIRIVDKIDVSSLNEFNGFFMGYSDITIFLNLIMEKSNNFVFHGPNLSDINKSDSGLIENIFKGLIPRDLCPDKVFLRSGKARGILCGGNLASLASLCGTKFMPVFKDKILFIEDVNESPYKIDKMLSQMRLCGYFEYLRGVIAGSFEGCGSLDIIIEILMENFKNIPIVFSDLYGHGKINNPLLLGRAVEINSFTERVSNL